MALTLRLHSGDHMGQIEAAGIGDPRTNLSSRYSRRERQKFYKTSNPRHSKRDPLQTYQDVQRIQELTQAAIRGNVGKANDLRSKHGFTHSIVRIHLRVSIN